MRNRAPISNPSHPLCTCYCICRQSKIHLLHTQLQNEKLLGAQNFYVCLFSSVNQRNDETSIRKRGRHVKITTTDNTRCRVELKEQHAHSVKLPGSSTRCARLPRSRSFLLLAVVVAVGRGSAGCSREICLRGRTTSKTVQLPATIYSPLTRNGCVRFAND